MNDDLQDKLTAALAFFDDHDYTPARADNVRVLALVAIADELRRIRELMTDAAQHAESAETQALWRIQ